MSNGERKSSDDLIREARRRLESPHSEPSVDSSSDDAAGDPVVEPAYPDLSIYSDPDVTAEADEPRSLVYRSQTTEAAEPAPHESPDPTRPASSPQHGLRRRGWLVWAVSVLLLGGGLYVAGLGDVTRDDSGQIVDAGEVDVLDLQIGDCFNDPEEFEELVYAVAAVPCSEPHDNEVFAVELLDDVFSGTFPGFLVLDEYTYDVCSGDLFDNYVGISYFSSQLEVFAFTPSEESWNEGDRGFMCVLYRFDLQKLTGSARDSGL